MKPNLIKKFANLIDRPWFQPALLFAASLGLYLATLPRVVAFEDSAEFVTAAASLGIPHPSGYPLYVLLAHPFALLPFGTLPWRVALFSAVCASAALAVGLLLARRLIRLAAPRAGRLASWAALLLLLQLAVSEIWWSQAIYAKIYALHALLLALAALALLSWFDRPERARRLYLAAFLLGLAASNHLYLTLAAAPVFLIAAFVFRPSLIKPSRLWLFAVLSAAAGLLPYLYIWFRAQTNPPYMMDRIETLPQFLYYVLRLRYHDIGAAAANRAGITFDLLWQFVTELGPVLIVFALAAVYRLGRRGWPERRTDRRPLAALTLAVGLVLAVPLMMLLRSISWLPQTAYISRVYNLAGLLFMAVLAGAGLAWALTEPHWHLDRLRPWALAALLGFMVAAAAVVNFGPVRLYADNDVAAYSRQMLERLPPYAVLLVNDLGLTEDTETFTLAYLQIIEKLRPDVTIVSGSAVTRFFFPGFTMEYRLADLRGQRRQMLEKVLGNPALACRPIFLTYSPEYLGGNWRGRSNGLVYELLTGQNFPQRQPADLNQPPLPPVDRIKDQPALAAFYSRAYYVYAALVAETEGNKAAQDWVIGGIALDPYPGTDDYYGFTVHRTEWMKATADSAPVESSATEVTPTSP